MEEEEKVYVELQVVKSKIPSPGGVGRVNSEILGDIQVVKGDEVEVSNEEKTILVKLTADPLMDKDKISLREPDMEKLELDEGGKIHLLAHETINEKLGELKEKIVTKFKKDEEDEEE